MASNTHFADDTAPYEIVHESEDEPKAASFALVVEDEATGRCA